MCVCVSIFRVAFEWLLILATVPLSCLSFFFRLSIQKKNLVCLFVIFSLLLSICREKLHRHKFYTTDRMRGNRYNSGSSSQNDVFSSPNGGRRANASLYNLDLVGDDFFMELAKIDLKCNYTSRKQPFFLDSIEH